MNTPDGFLAFRQDTESNVSPHAAFTKYHADARAPWIAPPGLRESDLGEERICKLVIALEQARTSDAAMVDVGAEVFWSRARADAPEDPTPPRELDRIARASLMETVCVTTIGALLLDRYALEQRLYLDIRSKAADWGLAVSAVAIREVKIPASLQFDNETRLVIALKQRVIRHRADRARHAMDSACDPAKDAT
ncbi:hypothetical protein [Methylibium sp.]|jgi:hypothetical protein|uniref:hypothetical protein n=1 Tax=Methylibium sp. TaxID=2067992 RepID=UPI003D12ED8C